jgi:single-stranded DNA-specific DHH superfamily exonuclease
MALTEKQYKQIKEELDICKRPLFFFHDDPDGVASFLLLYRYMKEGKGVIVKSYPNLDEKFLRKVEEYAPDKIFVLDLALVEQEFIDKANVPIIWIDHHTPQKREKVRYFNPRVNDKDDNIPTSYLCYQITKQDLWIAVCGTIGDWFLPTIANKFSKEYPKLLPQNIKKPEDALFKTKLGELIRVFSFVLKGTTTEAMRCVKILTRIESPYEILEQSTSQGKFLFKRFKKIEEEYRELLSKAVRKKSSERLLVFTYMADKTSFSGDLANELLYRFPNKVILIAREKSGEMRLSLRSGKKILLPPILEKALLGVEGYGGGHEHACGACVKVRDFERFVENIKRELKEIK